jgi:hypothetical protein
MAVWRECSVGVHVSSSRDNARSHTHTHTHMPARLSAPRCTNHSIPENVFHTFNSLTQNAVQFLKNMNDYFHFQSIDDSLN